MQFPFQEIYRVCIIQRSEDVSQMVQHATSEHGLARHQKMVEAESEHGSMEASEEHEIRSTEDQKMVSRTRSTSRSEDQKMHCTKLFNSDDIQTSYSQTSDQKEVQVADYAD